MSYGLRLIDSKPVELCDECGFDARDVADPVPEIVGMLTALDAQSDRPYFAEPPETGVYSGAEYAEHTVLVANVLVGKIEDAAGLEGTEEAADLLAAAHRLVSLTQRLDEDTWRCPVDMGEGMVVPITLVLTHLLHDASHHLWDVRRGIARIALAREKDLYTFR